METEGLSEAKLLGAELVDGGPVKNVEGPAVADGESLGFELGAFVGVEEGPFDGRLDGIDDGWLDNVGPSLGNADGRPEDEGLREGGAVGVCECEGRTLGVSVGDVVGSIGDDVCGWASEINHAHN